MVLPKPKLWQVRLKMPEPESCAVFRHGEFFRAGMLPLHPPIPVDRCVIAPPDLKPVLSWLRPGPVKIHSFLRDGRYPV
jgi:hypothetical protein